MIKKIKTFKRKFDYYFWASNRRHLLDSLQNKYKSCYSGIVLDIGGRDRGNFTKPKDEVKKWIFADIVPEHQPDIILDVSNMKSKIATESIDVVNAIELFEHVEKIHEGLAECYRIVKQNGVMILSVPFLYPVHGDPYDFQRWTKTKWKQELEMLGFSIEAIEIMGGFHSILSGMCKTWINALPLGLKYPFRLFFPILDLIKRVDNLNFIIQNPKFSGYHGGYFFKVRKVSQPNKHQSNEYLIKANNNL